MKKINKRQIFKIIFILLIILLCVFYLKNKITYTSYESNITGNVKSNIAKWNIYINDKSITTNSLGKVDIDNITWTTSHTRYGKVSPGSEGIINLVVDPLDTNVSIKYSLEIIDKKIDDTKLLTVTNVTNDKDVFTSSVDDLSSDNYTGIIELNDFGKRTISIYVSWIDDGVEDDYNKEYNSIDDFVEIYFTASQYNGE